MKVLWFTNTPSLYKQNVNAYNGGGWIESLELQIRKSSSDIELAISFFYNENTSKEKDENVIYYPVNNKYSCIQRFFKIIKKKSYEEKVIRSLIKIIEDFKPDIINIFGSEEIFGLVSRYTNIPIILHIQGILNPYYNAWYPPGYSMTNIVTHLWYNPVKLFSFYLTQFLFRRNALREREICSSIKYYMGRTEWDKKVISLLSPSSVYYYCSEILRPEFYKSPKWERHNERSKHILVTTISSPIYKGFDLILKTANLLTKAGIEFEWKVFGNIKPELFEKKTGIKIKETNVKLCGVASSDQLVLNLLDSDIFVHPSYIDNSPNSVCEAQLLGLPVISTYVGGIPSLIEDRVSGIMVPANDPYLLTKEIIDLLCTPQKMIDLGYNARKTALARHDPERIAANLIDIYREVLK